MSRVSWSVPALLALVSVSPPAHALPPGYTIEAVHTGLAFPVALRFAPDGRLFYVERGGRIMTITDPHHGTPAVWATLPTNISGEHGMLGLAFHPAFPDTPYVYVYHSHPSPLVNRVVRIGDYGGVSWVPQVLVELPAAALNHHGGRLAFGPDGMLYVSYGDQLVASSAPIPTDVRGKILRYTPLGRPAPENPWGDTNAAFVKGIRNAFGLCFDPLTGHGYFTNNGPECDDKVAHLVAGADYGWSSTSSCGVLPAGAEPAMLSYTPTIAPTGCCVFRGALDPYLDGCLLFGSYIDGRLRSARLDPADPSRVTAVETVAEFPSPVLDVTQDPSGLLWFSTGGSIYRVLPPDWPVGVGSTGGNARLSIAPNPFAGAVTLGVAPAGAFQRVEILDVAGRGVREWQGPFEAAIRWDGVDRHGERVPAGVYLVRATGKAASVTRRLVHLGR